MSSDKEKKEVLTGRGEGELAEYSNELNKIPLKQFSLVQKKIFMSLFYMVKNATENEIRMDYDYFMELAQVKPRSYDHGIKLIKQTFNKILSLSIAEFETELYDVEFLIFTSRKIIKETREIVVTVNPDYFFLVKDFADEFTKFPLKVGNSFNKYYTIDIYKFLRQYSDTGVWAVTVEDFKKYLNIPEVYGATKIREKIIEPAIEELKSHYSELSFKEVYKRKKKGERGRKKISSYRFFFTKEKRDQWENDKFVEMQKKETNVPEWSEPDYKNMTTDEQKAMMAEEKAKMMARLENIGKEDKEDETEEFNRLKKESDELLGELYGEDKK